MEGALVLILCVFAFTGVSGSHMQGGTISFRAREKHLDGWTVDFKYKASFSNGYGNYFYWYCFSGDCGYDTDHSIEAVDNSTSFPNPWYQYEGRITRRVHNDKPFKLGEGSCCWVYNNYYVEYWQLISSVDLGIRSDTKNPNRSPVTTPIPIIRIPQNCATTINLLAHDPDGDSVRCRYGYNYYEECAGCYTVFEIDESRCTLSVPSWMGTGSYVLELILEDFPKKIIRLTYNDGTIHYRYPTYNRNRREVPKKSQKYYWDGATATSDTWVSEYQTEVWTSDLEATDITKTLHTSDKTTTAITVEEATNAETTYATERFTDTPTESARDTVPEPETAPTQHVADLTTAKLVEASTERIFTEAVTFPYKSTEIDLYQTSIQSINTDSLSKISLQFLVEVTGPTPSCAFGDYIPRFISPTPRQGEILVTNAESVFQLHLSAHAAYESIIDFKVSGPTGITKLLTAKSRSNTMRMTVEWTPGENDLADHVPFCFVAETSNGYQSEMRCVTVVVGPHRLVNTVLTCHENTMTLIIEESPDNEFYENKFRLNDPLCLVTSNSTHLIASVGYNSCGTEIEETEHDIVFKNQVTSFVQNTSSVITRKHGISIPFNCSFPKKNRLSASFRAHKSDYVFAEAGFGNFTYKFQFYTDDQYVELETQYPLEVILRDLLYMEIQVDSTVPNVQLFVESCKATPHDNPNDPVFYDIIQNGCINDDTVMIYPGTRTQYRFAMEAFAFIGSYEEVYISCTVILCKMGEPNTRCNQGCIMKSLGDGRRRRRSLVSESQQHFISQGPLRMKRESPSDAGDPHSLNVNTLVIALSGVVIVALGAVTVHLYMKKARTTGYKRLNTQDS